MKKTQVLFLVLITLLLLGCINEESNKEEAYNMAKHYAWVNIPDVIEFESCYTHPLTAFPCEMEVVGNTYIVLSYAYHIVDGETKKVKYTCSMKRTVAKGEWKKKNSWELTGFRYYSEY